VTLIAEVPSIAAALDTHAGVTGVVEHGLVVLWNLAVVEANKVRPHVCEAACG
jgi:hypothetical protein